MGFKRLIKKGLLGGGNMITGTSHIYQMGKNDGRKQGTVEQAKRDEKKMQKMQEDHELDRQEWKRIDKEKDELIDKMEKNL